MADQVIDAIGFWGSWQRKYVIVLGLMTLFGAWPSLIITFMSPPTDFICSDAIRTQEDLSTFDWEEGRRPDVNIVNNCHGPDSLAITNSNSTETCSDFLFDQSTFTYTIVQQFNLICDRASWKNLAQSFYFGGMTLGVGSMGFLSDRFGRKAVLLPILLLTVISGVVLPFSPNIETFVAIRFLEGIFRIGIFSLIFVWCMEVVGGQWKTFVGIGLEFPWVLAWLLLSLFGYFITDWRKLQWITSIPGFVCVGLFCWMPESPKWLLTAGRLDDAERVVRKAAMENGHELPESWKLEPVFKGDGKIKKGNLFDLFKSKKLSIRTCILYLNWFANSFVYYGLTLNSGNLGGSYRLNFFINGCLELPAYILSTLVIHKAGRKVPYIALMTLGGTVLVSTILVPKEQFWMNWPILALAMTGKFCLTGSYAILYVYTAELFPTVVRSVGVGSSSVFARIGGMAAPFVGSLDLIISPTFPIAIFGLTSFMSGLLVILLPETKDFKLPDTLEEAEGEEEEQVSILKVPSADQDKV